MTVGQCRRDAERVAAALPGSGAPALNLCEDRYWFLLAYVAAAMRGVTSLLPPSRAPDVVAEVAAIHDGAHVFDDGSVSAAVRGPGPARFAIPDVEATTITYTSGSTGIPRPNARTWSSLVGCTHAKRPLLGPGEGDPRQRWVVATVPPQHMYGLEFSVLLPLLGHCAVHGGRPMLPADVADALRQVSGRRIVVTTPLHLRVLVASGVAMPDIERVICATAPLDPALAARTEEAWNCRVIEAFGSTETCAIAHREPVRRVRWRPFEGVTLAADRDGTRVTAPWLPEPALLQDYLEVDDEGGFTIVGRNSDMIEVAGKRASLGDLTQRVLAVDGVRDALVLQVEGDPAGLRRVAALVVAPGLAVESIVERLRSAVDPAFLPRPLLIVESLPRNELGKVTRERALELLRAGVASP